MPFDPKQLPPSVQAVYKHGVVAWVMIVETAITAGIKDLNKLTDIVFYLHFPERIGKPLKAYEKTLIDSWKGFRTLVSQRLSVKTKAYADTGGSSHYILFDAWPSKWK
jgi:hypothetical protein